MKPTAFIDPHRIRELRNKLGLSQARLAACLQAMRTSSKRTSLARTIQAWEKNGRVSEKWAIHLAQALKVEREDLVNSAANMNAARRVKGRPFIEGKTLKKMNIVLTKVTAIQTNDGKRFTCFLTDAQTNALVGYSRGLRPDHELIGRAFKMALGHMNVKLPPMIRVDRGM